MNKCGGDGGRSRNPFKQVVEGVYVERPKLSWRGLSWDGSLKPRGLRRRGDSGKGVRLSVKRAWAYFVGRSLRL